MADTLGNIGAQMANVMFNLAQRPGEPITGDIVATMDSLRKQWDAAMRAAVPFFSTAVDEMLDMLGRVHPYAMPLEDFKRAEERLERAVNLQQPLPVPDQAAIVWRGDLMSLMAELQHKRSVFDDWKKMRAQQAAAPTWGPVHTVGDMVRNLLTLDQAAPIFTASHVTIDRVRRCRTREVTISKERVVDGKWIDSARKDVPYTHIIWAKPDERVEQATALGTLPGWKLVPVEPTVDMVTHGFESEPDEFFSPGEDWDAYAEMTGCQKAAHRARLCYSAMLAAAPAALGNSPEIPDGSTSATGIPEAPKDERKGIELWRATLRACGELPEGYEVRIELENGCGMAVWYDAEGERHVIDGDGYLSDDVNEAVDAAIQRAAQLDGGQEGSES